MGVLKNDKAELVSGGIYFGPGERFNDFISTYVQGYNNGRNDVKEELIRRLNKLNDEDALRLASIINKI